MNIQPTTTNHLKEMSNMKEREYAQRVEELIPKEAELIEETKRVTVELGFVCLWKETDWFH